MCGIAGAVDLSASTTEDELRAVASTMAATLRHRGPDDEGTWIDAAAGLALGHSRLAIIDLSDDGHQPMPSADGRWVLDFNGEIYNHRALRRRLEGLGARFRSSSDTEVLVEVIAHLGPRRALDAVNGMFAFVVWDRRERRLTLARDRLGEKPLYYGWAGGHLLFASELKALRAHPAFDAEIDRDAVTLYLRHNYVPAPRSIHTGISKLAPGTMLTVDVDRPDERPTPTPYWSAVEAARAGLEHPLDVGPGEATDALDRLLRDSVAQRMVADVPLGAFLSGGIDSSTVVALMQAVADRPVRTFTIGVDQAGYDEASNAKAVAAHLATDHTELYVTADQAREVVPDLPNRYDEPFGDSSQIPTSLISALTRRHVKVALSGDGGDELFGGYTRYLFHEQIWRKLERVPRPARRGLAAGLRSVRPERWDRTLAPLAGRLPARLGQTHPGDKLHKLADVLDMTTSEDMFARVVSFWHDPARLVVDGREPATAITDPARRGGFGHVTDWMMATDAVTYLPDDILVKVDRASMAHSLEVRVPMLDHRVYELAWRLPRGYKLRGGTGKWLLRQVLARYVPPVLTERPKHGFGVPVGAWLRGPLRGWAEELLSERRLHDDGLLHPAPIRAAWQQHVSGTRDWDQHLWGVLMLQAWHESVRTDTRAAAR